MVRLLRPGEEHSQPELTDAISGIEAQAHQVEQVMMRLQEALDRLPPAAEPLSLDISDTRVYLLLERIAQRHNMLYNARRQWEYARKDARRKK